MATVYNLDICVVQALQDGHGEIQRVCQGVDQEVRHVRENRNIKVMYRTYCSTKIKITIFLKHILCSFYLSSCQKMIISPPVLTSFEKLGSPGKETENPQYNTFENTLNQQGENTSNILPAENLQAGPGKSKTQPIL